MSKERSYIADSGVEPSPLTPAQEAFFRYQVTLGSYEHALQHGAPEAAALGDELLERYETYRTLWDGRSVSYDIIAGGSPDLDEPASPHEQPPLRPNELPPEMADFLRDKEYACLLWGTDQGTVFVVKATARDIQGLRGNVPVQVTHELYQHPQAPVIRTVVTWYDQPQSPLALESYTNIEDPEQRADFLDLAKREHLTFLFYDRALRHRLSKMVRNSDPQTITEISETAERLRATIPEERFDFDAAKADIMRRTFL